jgi:hypothetical protein
VASVGIGNGPVLIGLAGMFLGAYLQGVLAEGRPKLQAGPQQGPG